MGTDSSDGDDARSSTGDRDPTSGWTEWVLVDGDRIVIAGAITVLVFCFLVGVEAIGFVSFDDGGPVSRVASGLIAGVFSLTTIVVSINQLILSREFTTPKESRERLDGVLSFHQDIEDATDVSTVPAEPTELLELLARIVDDRARTVRQLAEDHPDEEFRWRAKAVTDEVIESADSLDSSLESTDVGTFSALSATMRYDDPGRSTRRGTCRTATRRRRHRRSTTPWRTCRRSWSSSASRGSTSRPRTCSGSSHGSPS